MMKRLLQHPPASVDPSWREPPNATDAQKKPRFAFVGLLFGNSTLYCVDAMALGSMLAEHTQIPFVLLHTNDVPMPWRVELMKVGWQLRQVEYLDGEHLYIHGAKGRFAGVFTKLHALDLIEFDKIVMLDLDLLIRRNIDSLFERPTPSAMRRHATADFEDGVLINKDSFMNNTGALVSGINAGVMVLKPSVLRYSSTPQSEVPGQMSDSKAAKATRDSGEGGMGNSINPTPALAWSLELLTGHKLLSHKRLPKKP